MVREPEQVQRSDERILMKLNYKRLRDPIFPVWNLTVMEGFPAKPNRELHYTKESLMNRLNGLKDQIKFGNVQIRYMNEYNEVYKVTVEGLDDET